MKTNQISIREYALQDSLSMEIQAIADIISMPETLIDAERIISEDMFEDEKCRNAYNALRKMAKEGQRIDLPSANAKISKELMVGIVQYMQNSGSDVTANQHYAQLKEQFIKRICYYKGVEMLIQSSNIETTAIELIEKAGNFAEELRKQIDAEKGTQHISEVINELGQQIEEAMKDKSQGKTLRVPTGFYTLDYLTFGGFNRGNLVILAARPSVGKTAIMLHMAKAAASAGKTVNLFNLEMTNTELAQRMLFSTGRVTPLQMARGEVEWSDFEVAAGQYASKPMFLNDSARSIEEIRSRIVMNSQAGKCDIAFIDYLGLIKLSSGKANLSQAIADCTKELKHLAKACRIPIVLLCQLNRASASEKRAPEMYDLRDSGGIEQDADIILMLERDVEDVEEKSVNMWVRKNRQGKAGNIKVELEGNDTFTEFRDKNDPTPQLPPPSNEWMSDFDEGNDDIPF